MNTCTRKDVMISSFSASIFVLKIVFLLIRVVQYVTKVLEQTSSIWTRLEVASARTLDAVCLVCICVRLHASVCVCVRLRAFHCQVQLSTLFVKCKLSTRDKDHRTAKTSQQNISKNQARPTKDTLVLSAVGLWRRVSETIDRVVSVFLDKKATNMGQGLVGQRLKA